MSSQFDLLSSQFNTLLSQYQNTYQDYLNAIDGSSSSVSFLSVPNTAFVGATSMNVLENTTEDACLSSCSSNPSCSGATFSDSQNTCTLSSGTGGSIVSSSNQSAIVRQALYYSYQLQQINTQLSSVNSSMMSLSSSAVNHINQNQEKAERYKSTLEQNYHTLESERGEIESMVRQFEMLDSSNENSSLYVTSYYYSYLVYLIVAIFLMGILVKIGSGSSGNEQNGGGGGNRTIQLCILMAVILVITSVIKGFQ